MGHVFLWLHFIYDLVPLRYGPSIVEPLDFSEPLKWTKAHLFFSLKKKRDKGKQKQDEMHYKTHCTWIHWAMQKARWILSKVTHAFRRSGAQQLHDDGCSDNDIGSLGGWQQGEMRRSYVMGIPFKPVVLQAGFSGDRGDYYIGRAHAKLLRHEDKDKDEWWQLLGLMRKHIFPRVEEDLKKVHAWNAAQTDALKRHYAGMRFLETLGAIGRLVVAQDLAMMWVFCHQHGVRTPWCNCKRHPNVQMSPLCNHPLFQKWAYLVASMQFQGENLRKTSQTTANADAIFRRTAEEKMQKMYLTANLLREDLGKSKGREMQMAMENAKRPDQSRVRSFQELGPVAVEAFFIVVVVPWRESPTVSAVWKLWVQPSYIMGGKSLYQVCAEFCVDPNKNNNFFTAYAQFADKGKPQMTLGACERKMRRMHLVMQAVETFRVDSSEAETGTTVALLDAVYLLCNFTEFTNGLPVLHETPPNKKQKTGTSTEKRTVNDQAQRRVSWLILKMGLRDERRSLGMSGG
ncbi:unnamed protein product [Closterium sp. NIES-54]